MTKFVYVSGDFRSAWKIYLQNKFNVWPEHDEGFKEEFDFVFKQEQIALKKYARPPRWYLNDFMRENEFLFNMSDAHFNGAGKVKYEYTDSIGSESSDLKDLMLKRAEKISKMNKKIEIMYSGGIDSTAVVLAFVEVCKPDQLKIWMSGEGPVYNYPDMYKKIIGHLDYEFTDDLIGCCDPSQHVYCPGNEADRLFGADGYTMMMQHAKRDGDKYIVHDGEAPTTDAPENNEWNHSRWWGITRHTYLTQAFRLLQNIKCDKVDLANYQPLFFDHDILKFAINLHIEKKHRWFNSGTKADKDRYLAGKMWIRDFIYDFTGDKDYAYGIGKTLTTPMDMSARMRLPLPTNFNVLAITDDGTVVNRQNLMDYMNPDSLTI